jgi:tetratricopeptide (TPR) repeat protein
VVQAVGSLDTTSLQGALAQLVEAEIVAQRGLPPQATYTFKHALIQDAAYQSLLRSTRQQYHQRIAQVLVEGFPETVETQPEVVAQHYTAAGLHAQALAFWKRAGERALGRSAHQEAVACFEQALGAVQQLPESRNTYEQAIDLRLALRTALLPIGVVGRVLDVLREAEALATALDDSRRLGQVFVFMTIYFYFAGDSAQAITVGQRALALATASSDVGIHAVANTYLGYAYHAQGNYRQAIDCFGRTVAALDGPQRYERFGQVVLPAVSAYAWLAWCLAEVGRFAEGVALGEAGCRIAEGADHPASLLIASWGAGLPPFYQGDLPQALPRLERAMDIYHAVDLPVYFPRIAPALGGAYTLGGCVTDAMPLLTQAMEQATALARIDTQAPCSLALGEAQMQAGRLEEAHTIAERVLAFTRAHQELGHEAAFQQIIDDAGVERVVLPPRAPNLNAYAERWMRSVKDEALSRMILFGEDSLRYVLNEYMDHYHQERHHQGKGNVLLCPQPWPVGRNDNPMQYRERLGGLLKYYERKAA